MKKTFLLLVMHSHLKKGVLNFVYSTGFVPVMCKLKHATSPNSSTRQTPVKTPCSPYNARSHWESCQAELL